MKNKNLLILVCSCLFIFFLFQEPVYAGAGGTIAKAVTKSFWGKFIIALIVIIFLPVILYTYFQEYFAERKTMKDLEILKRESRVFNWMDIKARASDIFTRVQKAWANEQVSEAAEWMSPWYWQNQQIVYLDKWEQKGLKNYTEIKKVNKLRPLYVECSDEANYVNSRIVVAIEANMEDFLARRSDNRIVEGEKGFKDVETVWTLVYDGKNWVVDNIESDSLTLAYAKLQNYIPVSIREKIQPAKA